MQAESDKILKLLKTAKGQLEGIIRMVEEDRYCIDISHQMMASEAVLRKANKEVLTAHLKHCVKTADSEKELEEKIEELVGMLDRLMR